MALALTELSDIFKLLDPIQGRISALLKGREPPTIIVFGKESSGKSTILERILM